MPPVEVVVAGEVAPRVAVGADQPAGPGTEPGTGEQVGGHRAVARQQPVAAAAGPVVHPVVGEGGVVERVEPVAAAVERLQAYADGDAVVVGRGDVLLGQLVAAVPVGAHLGEAQAPRVGALHLRGRVARGAVGEGLPVGHDELEAADAGCREVGVEHLAHPAVLEREPHVAPALPGGPEAGLVGLGPGRPRPPVPGSGGGTTPRGGLDGQRQGAGDGDGQGRRPREESTSHHGTVPTVRVPRARPFGRGVGSAGQVEPVAQLVAAPVLEHPAGALDRQPGGVVVVVAGDQCPLDVQGARLVEGELDRPGGVALAAP